jgi:hypothetical protein
VKKQLFPIDPGANVAITSPIKDINPYTYPAGPELDELIHRRLFGQKNATNAPNYSLEVTESAKVRSRLKTVYGHPIIVGRTRMPGRPFFARYESDPSTATEVVAETEPLAICRLALLLMRRGE